MRSSNILVLSVSLFLAAPILPQQSNKARGAMAQTAPRQPVFTASSDMKWTDLDPTGAPGVKIANLWGDHTRGHSARC